MASRGIRVMLWWMVVLAAVTSGYFVWVDESETRRSVAATEAFADTATLAGRALLDLRAAQQGYVAAGQGHEFWASKAAGALASAKQALDGMRRTAAPAAASALQSAVNRLEDFEQMDRRALEYVRSGQNLMASDVIFSDGLEMMEAAWADVQRARAAQEEERDRWAERVRRRQWLTLAAGALAMCALTLLLVPVARPPAAMTAAITTPVRPIPAITGGSQHEELTLRLPPASPSSPAFDIKPPSPPDVDLAAVGTLCSDLARLSETHSLSGMLERIAGVLDAEGIVLWIADPDGRELAPVLAHGYPPQLVVRLGSIPRDAENVTAASFRTGLLQTVKGDDVSNGAIAAPLVTAAGCVGVMAVEVRHRGEQQHARLAAATIIAAQLATLVGPPVARAGKAGAAGG